MEILRPEWPAPSGVRAFMTTRAGGVSVGRYASMNLGQHCGDDEDAVAENRRRAAALCGGRAPRWLEQVHGIDVVDADASSGVAPAPRADASIARREGTVCAIQVADCMPVLFADSGGAAVAAAHAGWRGLVGGVLEATVRALDVEPGRIFAWLGPAIGPQAYEVGDEVRAAFLGRDSAAAAAFRPSRSGHWYLDLYWEARRRLTAAGLGVIHGGGWCTLSDPARFYSFRRDGQTGRMAAFIWREEN